MDNPFLKSLVSIKRRLPVHRSWFRFHRSPSSLNAERRTGNEERLANANCNRLYHIKWHSGNGMWARWLMVNGRWLMRETSMRTIICGNGQFLVVYADENLELPAILAISILASLCLGTIRIPVSCYPTHHSALTSFFLCNRYVILRRDKLGVSMEDDWSIVG